MGTDIHGFIEVKEKNGPFGTLKTLFEQDVKDGIFKHLIKDEIEKKVYRSIVSMDDDEEAQDMYFGRSYVGFALISNVRNYEDLFHTPYLNELPDDIDPMTKNVLDAWGSDLYGHACLYKSDFEKTKQMYIAIIAIIKYCEYQKRAKNEEISFPKYRDILYIDDAIVPIDEDTLRISDYIETEELYNKIIDRVFGDDYTRWMVNDFVDIANLYNSGLAYITSIYDTVLEYIDINVDESIEIDDWRLIICYDN